MQHSVNMNDNLHNRIRESYGRRASSYDMGHGGWHITLGQEFVDWLDPQVGERALDLACGTGLITLPLAQRVGSKGEVVAVDLTSQMIEVGRERLNCSANLNDAQGMAPITWITADITSEDLLSQPAIQRNLDEHGGFDIISVCSAFVLLPDQRRSLQFWVEKLLRKGGRIIIDVPKEDLTVHFLLTYHLLVAIGLPDDLSRGRLWIKDKDSLANMFEEVGLVAERNIVTQSYLSEVWHDSDIGTGSEVLEKKMTENLQFIKEEGRVEEARGAWPGLWQQATRKGPDGREGVEEAHRLYVCIGRKSLENKRERAG